MKKKVGNYYFPLSLVIIVFAVLSFNCQKTSDVTSSVTEGTGTEKNPQMLKDFMQVNLVANDSLEYLPANEDQNLINAWGIAFSSTGTPWVASEGRGVSTVYNQFGAEVRPPVNIPSPGGPTGGHVTGVVFNGGSDFVLSNGQPARFMFVGVDGIISGWNPTAGSNALLIKNNSATSVYTGLAIASSAGQNYIYAADFRANRIDVYDRTFTRIMNMPFMDSGIPAGYAPFNIQAIGTKLYVMYAKVGVGEEETGPGLGYVSIFNTDGSFVKRFISRGQLNAPWGIAMAPPGFWGSGSNNPANVILVGNFGDGRINAFNEDGIFLGQLRMHGEPIIIEGLWGISFAPTTATSINPNKLFFAAGPDDEEDGLFGYIIK